jgi:hypothetical protein
MKSGAVLINVNALKELALYCSASSPFAVMVGISKEAIFPGAKVL